MASASPRLTVPATPPFDPRQHPRAPQGAAGTYRGGQFVPKDEAVVGTAAQKTPAAPGAGGGGLAWKQVRSTRWEATDVAGHVWHVTRSSRTNTFTLGSSHPQAQFQAGPHASRAVAQAEAAARAELQRLQSTGTLP